MRARACCVIASRLPSPSELETNFEHIFLPHLRDLGKPCDQVGEIKSYMEGSLLCTFICFEQDVIGAAHGIVL